MALPLTLRTPFWTGRGRLRLPWRLLWNGRERRPRLPVRLAVGAVAFFLLVGLATSVLSATVDGSTTVGLTPLDALALLPRSAAMVLTVYLVGRFCDRRTFADFGLDRDGTWFRELTVGVALGFGLTAFALLGSIALGWVSVVDVHPPTGSRWLWIAGGAAAFQFLYAFPEELLIRAYLVTNVTEAFDGFDRVPRALAALIAIILSGGVFYVTHAGRSGATVWFGIMAGALALVFALAYVLTGNLAIPVGFHVAFNVGGFLVGFNPQPVSLLSLSATGTPALAGTPVTTEVVLLRVVGVACCGAALALWYGNGHAFRVAPSVAVPELRWRETRPKR